MIELKTIYSLEDLYNMWEVTYTTVYNRWVAEQKRLQSERLRRGR